jgi:hypothetical protein
MAVDGWSDVPSLIRLGWHEGWPAGHSLTILRSTLLPPRLLLLLLRRRRRRRRRLLLVQLKRIAPPGCPAQSTEFALQLHLPPLLQACRHLIKMALTKKHPALSVLRTWAFSFVLEIAGAAAGVRHQHCQKYNVVFFL